MNACLVICDSASFGPKPCGARDLQWMNLTSQAAMDSVSNKGGVDASKSGYDVPEYKIISDDVEDEDTASDE